MASERHLVRIGCGSQVCSAKIEFVNGRQPRTVVVNGRRYAVLEDLGIIVSKFATKVPDREHMDYKCMRTRCVTSCKKCCRFLDCAERWDASHEG